MTPLPLNLPHRNHGSFDGTTWFGSEGVIEAVNPSTGHVIGEVTCTSSDGFERCMHAMEGVKKRWASTPAPERGAVVKAIGKAFSEHKEELAKLVSMEVSHTVYSVQL